MRTDLLTVVACAVVASGALGCPQRVTTRPSDDAGGGGADGSVAVVDAGAPGPDAGDPGPDGGAADGGAPSGFAWGQVALPNTNQTPTAVWGWAADDVYVGTAGGFLFRLTPAGASQVWRTPNNLGVRRIWGVQDRLFVADERTLYLFDRSDPSTALRQELVGSAIGGMHGIAGDQVYLASARTNDRSLYLFDGAEVRELFNGLETASLNAVWADEAALGGVEVRIAGNGRVLLYDGLTLSDEPTEWPQGWSLGDIANFFVYDLTRVGDVHVGVGTAGGVLVRPAGGPWRFERPADGSADFEAVSALPGVEGGAVAVGEDVDGRHPIWWRAGGQWRPDPYDGFVSLLDVWAADADTVYAVGFRRGGSGGAVTLVGRRR